MNSSQTLDAVWFPAVTSSGKITSQGEPLAQVACPKCQNPTAVIAYTRDNELKCFCSRCVYGWDMTKPAGGSTPFAINTPFASK